MSSNLHVDPSLAFRFKVTIEGVTVARFTEVSGLQVESDTEKVTDGGDYSTVYRLPTGFKGGDLTQKRGIAKDGAALWDWIKLAVNGTPRPHKVTLSLLGFVPKGGGSPTITRTWVFLGAYPIKWSATALSADQNGVAVETLTLAHQGIQFE